jgi:uncharacterized RDD family membrane protein YckC
MKKNQYGGFWMRICASIIDGIILTFFSILVRLSLGLKIITHTTPSEKNEALATLLIFLCNFFYLSVFQAQFKGSIGKHCMGLVLVDAENLTNMSLPQSVGRLVMQYVSIIVFFLGLITISFSRRKQGWHDLAAGTLVIKKDQLKMMREEEGLMPDNRAA